MLTDPGKRPKSLVTPPSKKSKQEAKTTKELFALAVNFDDGVVELTLAKIREKHWSHALDALQRKGRLLGLYAS